MDKLAKIQCADLWFRSDLSRQGIALVELASKAPPVMSAQSQRLCDWYGYGPVLAHTRAL